MASTAGEGAVTDTGAGVEYDWAGVEYDWVGVKNDWGAGVEYTGTGFGCMVGRISW